MALKQCGNVRSLILLRSLQPQTAESMCSHSLQKIILGARLLICNRHIYSGIKRCQSLLSTEEHPMNSVRHCLSHVCSQHKKQTRLVSSAVVSRFTKDIDIQKLKEEVKRESRESGQQIMLTDRIKDLVAQRCLETIQQLDEDGKKKLKVLQLEYNFLYSEGHDIPNPDCMTNEMWLEAMERLSKSQRLKYYQFLQKRFHLKKSEEEKKAAYKEEMLSRESQEVYEHGRIIMRVYPQTMRRWLSNHLASAMTYGLPLVFDMDFVKEMRPQEQKNTAKQLHDSYCLNRSDPTREPFHLHFTRCQPDNAIYKMMQIQTQDSPTLLSTVTEKCYMDLFDKDSLVYLSPHSRQVMKEFDPNAVYIIAAFNDKATQKPVSYGRAMEHGIQCQRLPIDEHVNWNQGSKNLTLDQVMRIMLDVKNKLPWKTAFRHIPKRKLR